MRWCRYGWTDFGPQKFRGLSWPLLGSFSIEAPHTNIGQDQPRDALLDVPRDQQLLDVSEGLRQGVATTEIRPKDSSSSFVKGVNRGWASMFEKVSRLSEP